MPSISCQDPHWYNIQTLLTMFMKSFQTSISRRESCFFLPRIYCFFVFFTFVSSIHKELVISFFVWRAVFRSSIGWGVSPSHGHTTPSCRWIFPNPLSRPGTQFSVSTVTAYHPNYTISCWSHHGVGKLLSLLTNIPSIPADLFFCTHLRTIPTCFVKYLVGILMKNALGLGINLGELSPL